MRARGEREGFLSGDRPSHHMPTSPKQLCLSASPSSWLFIYGLFKTPGYRKAFQLIRIDMSALLLYCIVYPNQRLDGPLEHELSAFITWLRTLEVKSYVTHVRVAGTCRKASMINGTTNHSGTKVVRFRWEITRGRLIQDRIFLSEGLMPCPSECIAILCTLYLYHSD